MTKRRSRLAGKLTLLGLLAVLTVGGVVYGASRLAADRWYDAAPLFVSIRPDARAGLTRALGIARAEDLTLYDLDLAYDPTPAAFTLSETVWFTNTSGAPLPDLVFRIYANASPPDAGPQVRFVSGACEGDPGCVVTTPNPSAVRVQPSSVLAPSDRLRITLKMTGNLSRIDSSRTNLFAQGLEGMMAMLGGGSGATSGDYGILGVGDGIVSFGNFYAVLARRVAGVWETGEASKLGDLGSDRMASFRARIELPAHAKLAVTGAVTSDAPIAGKPDRREVRVAAAAIRDFAILFGDAMETETRDVRGTHVRSFHLTADRAAGVRALDVASHAFEDFERRFGPYPYADLTVSEAAVVGGAGGVEFSGLVTAASMFYRPTSGGGGSGGGDDGIAALLGKLGGAGGGDMTETMLEFVVAHEVAHQWWHGLVGSDSRDHPYEDEALAQYSALLYLQDRYGAPKADKLGDMNVKMNFQSMRMLGTADVAADQPVGAFASSVQYAGVVYGKAPYYYKAVRGALGDAAFFTALTSYVTRYRFREAPARALPDLFAQAGGEAKMRPLERHWLDEAHGDADLGKLDLGSMLGGLLGAGGAGGPAGLDGAEMEEIMKLLGGAGGGLLPGGPGPSGSAAPKGGDMDLDKLLKDLGGVP
ncbi:MAG: M1 family aminopeptidase [Polyangiaceae bacterium]|jgi:hypothetical protein